MKRPKPGTAVILLCCVSIAGCQPVSSQLAEQGMFTPTASPTPTLISLAPPVTTTPTSTPVPLPTLTPTYNPGDAAAMLAAGDRNYSSGNLAGALNDYSLAIRVNPEFADAYISRGIAYTDFGNLQAALNDLDIALELAPNDVRALVARAEVARQQSDYDNALIDLTLAEQIDPTYGPLYLVRGKLYFAQGDSSRALNDLDAAVITLPDIPEPYIVRAHVYSQMGELSAALVDLNVALALTPDNAEALADRGEVHQKLGQPEQAITDFEEALSVGEASFSTLLHLGQAYLAIGRNIEAENVLSRAVTLSSDDPEGHYWYGLAAFAAKDYSQAVDSASVVLAYRPRNIEALALRATANLYRGYLSNAQADYEAAYEIDPTYVEALIGLAEVSIRRGDYPAAQDALRSYLDVAPPDAPSRTVAQAALEALSTAGTATPVASLLSPHLYTEIGH